MLVYTRTFAFLRMKVTRKYSINKIKSIDPFRTSVLFLLPILLILPIQFVQPRCAQFIFSLSASNILKNSPPPHPE